jgi:hypothetical protein
MSARGVAHGWRRGNSKNPGAKFQEGFKSQFSKPKRRVFAIDDFLAGI